MPSPEPYGEELTLVFSPITIPRMEITKQSLGGKVTALKTREAALKKYYANPSICIQCYQIIKVKPSEKIRQVRIRKFCNHSCAATFYNPRRPIRRSLCVVCQKNPRKKKGNGKTCESCFDKYKNRLGNLTKGETNARSIRNHARVVAKPEGKSCNKCGYSKHVEVCHRKAVSLFPKTALVKEINSFDNLILLCPNCHWEFDHFIA